MRNSHDAGKFQMKNLFGEEVKVSTVEEEPKHKRVQLFDWLTDLSFKKEGLFNPNTKNDFVTFMINRGFAQHLDTIMYANEMNKHPYIDKELVHDFYFYVLPKKKRYGKWAKQNVDDKEILDIIMKHYCVNRLVAIEYLKLLTSEQIEYLKQSYAVGEK
jgi:hypothetical protein